MDTIRPETIVQTDGERICFAFDNLPTMDDLQARYVEYLLSLGGFSRARIAQTLGISERTVYRILGARQRKGEHHPQS